MTLQQTDRLAALDADGRSLLLHAARTANTFAPTPVEDAELEAIWELARWPPTAANTQPLRVLYVRTEQGRARLVANMADGNKAETATAPAVLAFDSRFHEHVPAMFPIRPEPADALAADEPMRTGMGSFNSALQAGYFLLAVRAEGWQPARWPGSTRTASMPSSSRRPLAVGARRQHRPPRRGPLVRPAPPPPARGRRRLGLSCPPRQPSPDHAAPGAGTPVGASGQQHSPDATAERGGRTAGAGRSSTVLQPVSPR